VGYSQTGSYTVPKYTVFAATYNGGGNTPYIGLYEGYLGTVYFTVSANTLSEIALGVKSVTVVVSNSSSEVQSSASVRIAAYPRSASSSTLEATSGTKSANSYRAGQDSLVESAVAGRSVSHTVSGQGNQEFSTTSVKSAVFLQVGYAVGMLATTGTAIRSIFRSSPTSENFATSGTKNAQHTVEGSTSLTQSAPALKFVDRVRSAWNALQQTAVASKGIIFSRDGESALHQATSVWAYISQLVLTNPILFTEFLTFGTQIDHNTDTMSEVGTFATVADPTTTEVFTEPEVSSFTERKWNNA